MVIIQGFSYRIVEIVSMKIYRKAEEEWSLFDEDPVYDRSGNVKEWINALFDEQNRVAAESEVFKRILEQEIKEDPSERLDSTNRPKSKTRNALISRAAYHSPSTKEFDKEAWEQDLLSNPFYGLA